MGIKSEKVTSREIENMVEQKILGVEDARHITDEIIKYAKTTLHRQNTLREKFENAIENGVHVALGLDALGYAEHIAAAAGYNQSWSYEITQTLRIEKKEKRDSRIHELREDGKTQREISNESGVPQQTVSRILTQNSGNGKMGKDSDTGNATKAEGGKPHVSHNSGNNEWYTPKEYIDAARATLGDIDLDPASSQAANEVVGASRYFTIEDDGLTHDWAGRVWMNPPYAAGLINRFAGKLAEECRAGAVTDAIVLVNNATETGWFRELIGIASSVCFTHGRVRFWKNGGEVGAPLQGQAIIYIGENAQKFSESFSNLGWIAHVE